jgi:hypothetical protein
LPTKRRIVSLFYRCIERVHVDVNDFARSHGPLYHDENIDRLSRDSQEQRRRHQYRAGPAITTSAPPLRRRLATRV